MPYTVLLVPVSTRKYSASHFLSFSTRLHKKISCDTQKKTRTTKNQIKYKSNGIKKNGMDQTKSDQTAAANNTQAGKMRYVVLNAHRDREFLVPSTLT